VRRAKVKDKQPVRPKPVLALALRVWSEASRFSNVHDLRALEEQVLERVRRLSGRENSGVVRTPPVLPAEAFRHGREWAVRPEPLRPVQADRRDELRPLVVRDNHTFRGKKKGP
jgi:hypothetical protein